ncbi:MAG: hypothetical protein Q9165_002767 [Trypethelium subeluteriae]
MPPPLFTRTPRAIEKETRSLIETLRNVQDRVAKIQPDVATFANVLLPLAHAENAMALKAHIIIFYKDVSPDPRVRAASNKAKTLLDDFTVETAMREDLFEVVDAVFNRKNEDLDPESLRFLVRKHRDFIRNGLKLPAGSTRDRFKEIKSRLTQLIGEYGENTTQSDSDSSIWLSILELDGVPGDVVSRLKQRNEEHEGKLRIPLNHLNVTPVLRYAKSAETRKRIYIANDNKCSKNIPIMKEALILRDEAARLLGYPDHATFRLEDLMAKTPKVVNAFLEDLQYRLAAGSTIEIEELKRLKRRDVESRGEKFDGLYFLWDHFYYERLMLEWCYSVDQQKVSEYFSLETTVSAVLDLFQQLFGLEFEEISNGKDKSKLVQSEESTEILWHEDVQLFSVWDNDRQRDEFLGYLYLDLFPRDGKYGHASSFNVVPPPSKVLEGFIREDGSRQYPATALVCNFAKPTATKPSLLRHDELVTLLHEMGHGIHDLVSKTAFSCFHGFETVIDFGEAPSQMLENWCWTPSVLKKVSRHYSSLSQEYLESWKEDQGKKTENFTPSEQIPDDMVENLIKAKHVNSALFNLRQIAYATFDMAIHQPDCHEAIKDMNVSAKFNYLRRTILPIASPELYGQGDDWGDDWGDGAANFGPIMGEYDAGYYSYLL